MRAVQTRRLNADLCHLRSMSVQETPLRGCEVVLSAHKCSRTALYAVRGHRAEKGEKSSCRAFPYDDTRPSKQALNRVRMILRAFSRRKRAIFPLLVEITCLYRDKLVSLYVQDVLGVWGRVRSARHTPHALFGWGLYACL
jgi:hypothetical protein